MRLSLREKVFEQRLQAKRREMGFLARMEGMEGLRMVRSPGVGGGSEA